MNGLQPSSELTGSAFEIIDEEEIEAPANPSLVKARTFRQVDIMKVPFPRIVLQGDLLFRIMNKGPLKKSLICRFSFNTAFVTEPQMELSIKEVDPCAIKKDSKVSKNFQVDLISKPYCQECSPKIPIEELCTDCARQLKYEIPKWQRMH